MTYDVVTLRQREFPNTGPYLNHAGISPIPARTVQAVQDCVQHLGAEPSHFFHHHFFPTYQQFMQDIAAWINASNPTDICPVTSTSQAISMVATAIDWQAGDRIMFCDIEFPSNAYPWMSLEQTHQVNVVMIEPDGGTLTVESLDRAIQQHSKPRLVAVSALQFFTGARADLSALGTYCHENGILFVVDAIQAIGHIPIDVQAMHIDILATGGQKSLMALAGIGFLYVERELAERLQPASIGPNAVQGWDHWLKYDLTPLAGAARFGSGTPNVPGISSVVSSLSLLRELGREAIDAYTTSLSHYAIHELDQRGYQLVTPHDVQGPIVTFSYGDHTTTDALLQRLTEAGVSVTKHLDRIGNPYVRLSVHCYNREDDLQCFLNAL
ncbi:MAG: aminotransferase class V-fold PLP-dependent enzyme [Anaerolineales bacterium]|nr:aminotransferase class V-fold PLP-dependent enzyme [Anaerolineales bacterium]